MSVCRCKFQLKFISFTKGIKGCRCYTICQHLFRKDYVQNCPQFRDIDEGDMTNPSKICEHLSKFWLKRLSRLQSHYGSTLLAIYSRIALLPLLAAIAADCCCYVPVSSLWILSTSKSWQFHCRPLQTSGAPLVLSLSSLWSRCHLLCLYAPPLERKLLTSWRAFKF